MSCDVGEKPGSVQKNVISQKTSFFRVRMTIQTAHTVDVDEMEPAKQCIRVGTHSLHWFEVLCLRVILMLTKTFSTDFGHDRRCSVAPESDARKAASGLQMIAWSDGRLPAQFFGETFHLSLRGMSEACTTKTHQHHTNFKRSDRTKCLVSEQTLVWQRFSCSSSLRKSEFALIEVFLYLSIADWKS